MTDIDTKHESVTSTSNTVTRTISYQPTQTSMKEDVLFIGIYNDLNNKHLCTLYCVVQEFQGMTMTV